MGRTLIFPILVATAFDTWPFEKYVKLGTDLQNLRPFVLWHRPRQVVPTSRLAWPAHRYRFNHLIKCNRLILLW